MQGEATPQYLTQQPNAPTVYQGQQQQQQQYVVQQPYNQVNQQQQQVYNPNIQNIQQQQQPIVVQQYPVQQTPYVTQQPIQVISQPNNSTVVTYNNNSTSNPDPSPQYETKPMVKPQSQYRVQSTEIDYGQSNFGARLDYESRTFQDKIAALAWIVTMIGMIVGLINEYSSNDVDTGKADKGILVVLACAGCGILMGFMWMQCMKQCAANIIKFMLYGMLIWMGICTILAFTVSVFFGLIMLIFTALFAFYVYRVQRRIPLAAAMLEIATEIIETFKGTVWVGVAILVLMIIWIIWWSAVTAAYTSRDNPNGFVVLLLILVFYWTLQVFKNISHVTTCSVTAVWFFTKQMPYNPTSDAFKNACTKSLGPICVGSFLVAVIQTLRALIRSLQTKRNNILYCIIQCLLGVLESLVRWFNTYAFAQVAIYGTSFIDSAKATWSLLKSKGIDAWINDDLTGFALSCGALIGGLICGIVGLLLALSSNSLKNDAFIYFLIGLIVGYYLCATVLLVVRSAVVCLFVCWAEDPQSMAFNRPEAHEKFNNAWSRVYGRGGSR